MIVTGLLFLASAALRGIVIAAIVKVALTVFRVMKTDARLLAWQMVLYTAIALPVLSVTLPTHDWSPSLPALAVEAWSPALATGLAPPAAAGALQAPTVDTFDPVTSPAVTPESVRSQAAVFLRRALWSPIVALGYIVGCLLLLIRGAVGWSMTRQLESGADGVDETWIRDRLQARADACGLRRRPRLAESDALSVPVTTSLLAPAIVLPRTWRSWPSGTVDAVLIHELAHIERGDMLTQRLALLYRAVFWFSPLAWWLHRELVRLAEDASDEAALAAGTAPSAYAEVLLSFVASIRSTTARVQWSTIAMARGFDAERRIERILAWRRPARALSRPVIFCVALAASQAATFAATARWVIPNAPLPALPSVPRLVSTAGVPAPSEISHEPIVAFVQAPASGGGGAAASKPATQRGGPCDLCKAIQDPRLTWLQNYVGRSTFDAIQDSHFRDLMGMVVPNATYHFGTDMGLGEAWMTILRAAGRPVAARSTKYLWLSSCVNPRCQAGRGLAFLWVDTLDAVAIGGIYFAPSNGEPTPTLTLFSKQQGSALTKASQLPDAFLQDLATWSANAGLEQVSARYFISGNGDKSLVPHEEHLCGDGPLSGTSAAPCGSTDLRLAEKDLDAALYMADSHNAMGSPAQLALRVSQNLWAQSRAKACGATQSTTDVACQIKFVRDRVEVLQSAGAH